MRLTLEYDAARAGAWVAAAGHPDRHAVAWLARGEAPALRIEGRDGPRGYFWYAWTGAAEMALYACVAGRRGLWTRQMVGDLHKFPELLGARRLIAVPPDRRVAALLRRLGWTGDDRGRLVCRLPSKWSRTYGRDFPIDL